MAEEQQDNGGTLEERLASCGDRVEVQPNGSVRVKLRYPIEHKSKSADTLLVRRMRVGDLDKASRSEGDMAKSMTLTALMTRQDVELVRDLDMEDFDLIQTVIGEVTPSGKS